MVEPVIITAFWDVGRGSNCAIPRTNERYYKEFKEWARIKNRLIVYTDEKSAPIIKKIREEYGLIERTTVIVTENIFEIEPDIYRRMHNVEAKADFSYKYFSGAMSNRAKFDYAWFMIYWCISDARKYVEEDTLLAWFDFGFNHINSCFTKMEEFDFLWNCEVDMTKIHLFSLVPLDDVSVIDIFQFQHDTLMGVFHLIPAALAGRFWELIRQAMISLLMLQCIDDDQMLLLMAVKYQPELFKIHISKWYLSLKEMGALNLTVKETKKNSFLKKIKKPFIGIRGDYNFIQQIKGRLKRTRKLILKYTY